MPQPRDITGSIYKSKKLKARLPKQKHPGGASSQAEPSFRVRRLGFNTFSFAVGLLLAIAFLGQFALMTLFKWL